MQSESSSNPKLYLRRLRFWMPKPSQTGTRAVLCCNRLPAPISSQSIPLPRMPPTRRTWRQTEQSGARMKKRQSLQARLQLHAERIEASRFRTATTASVYVEFGTCVTTIAFRPCAHAPHRHSSRDESQHPGRTPGAGVKHEAAVCQVGRANPLFPNVSRARVYSQRIVAIAAGTAAVRRLRRRHGAAHKRFEPGSHSPLPEQRSDHCST